MTYSTRILGAGSFCSAIFLRAASLRDVHIGEQQESRTIFKRTSGAWKVFPGSHTFDHSRKSSTTFRNTGPMARLTLPCWIALASSISMICEALRVFTPSCVATSNMGPDGAWCPFWLFIMAA